MEGRCFGLSLTSHASRDLRMSRTLTSCGVVGDVLVVAPMEAVWLTGSELQLQDGRGCLSFEVKGE